MTKRITMFLAAAMAAMCATADPVVTDVVAKQRYPWNGKVDISFKVSGDLSAGLPDGATPVLYVMATDRANEKCYIASRSALSGDTGAAAGSHHVVWDLNAQGLEFKSDNVLFRVVYSYYGKYCVIDLSAGDSASSYPVSYLDKVPSGGWTYEYKSTKLVLRLIEPGVFIKMDRTGSSCQVTLTQPFYCGIFEMTQNQYLSVTGRNPSKFWYGPVEQVSWNDIRGDSSTYDWPSCTDVDSDSFMGRLRTRTGLNFDLPTEAQWAYASSAGGTSDQGNYNNCWYLENSSKGSGPTVHDVGELSPNAWGLYDMFGNLWEWCLDWEGNLSGGVDPVGASSGSDRISRGGCYYSRLGECTAFASYGSPPSNSSHLKGFRIVQTLPSIASSDGTIGAGDSAAVAIDSRTGIVPLLNSATVTWDASWIGGNPNATIVILDNGTEIKRVTGKGEFSISGMGCHRLTYKTYVGGTAQEETYDSTLYLRWKYNVSNGDAIITETTQTSGKVVIPSAIDGYPVKRIPNGMFHGCAAITGITIPTSVTEIGEGAFSGCTGLTQVVVPKSVQSIANGAFGGCVNLQTMEIPFVGKSRGVSGSSESVFGYIFGNYDVDGMYQAKQSYGSSYYDYSFSTLPISLRSVTVTDETIIGCGAFSDCRNLKSVTLNVGVREIRARAFADSGLESVKVQSDGASRIYIGDEAFAGCNALATATLPPMYVDFGSGVFDGCELLADANGFFIADGRLLAYFGTGDHLTLPSGIDSIDAGAFHDRTTLKSVVIPSTVTWIGDGVFRNCSALKSIAIPSSVTWIGDGAFDGCTALESVSLPSGLENIGKRTFGDCVSLSSLVLPDDLLSIDEAAFAGCSGFKSVTLCAVAATRSLQKLFPASYRTLENVTLPGGLEEIVYSAFEGCSSLKRIVVPSGVTNIAARAFYGCSALGEVRLSDGLRLVGDRAFSACTALPYLNFPAGVERLGGAMFAGDTNLVSVLLPEGIKALGNSMFDECRALSSIALPIGLETIGSGAFWNCGMLGSVTIPSGVKSVGENAFRGCTNLVHITMPGTIETIGGGAFTGCGKIESAIMPGIAVQAPISAVFPDSWQSISKVVVAEGADEIGAAAFQDCKKLSEIVLPASVVLIGENAFTKCSSLMAVHFMGDAPMIGSSLYLSTPARLVTYVTRGSINWNWVNATSTALPEQWPVNADGTRRSDSRGIAFEDENPYAPIICTVTLDPRGGTVSSSVRQVMNSTAVGSLPTPAKAGYAFLGWFTAASGGTSVDRNTIVTGNVTYYAHWMLSTKSYVVSFDTQGGTPKPASVTVGEHGIIGDLPQPVLAGYTFDGWFTAAKGGLRISATTEVTCDVTYYAHWTEIVPTYKLTFGKNGGTGGDNYVTATYGKPMPTPRTAPKQSGWTFAGYWDTLAMDEKGNAKGKKYYDADMKSVRNWDKKTATTLWAKWTNKVTFGKNGGTGGDNYVTCTKGQPMPKRTMPTKSGYTFAGYWNTTGAGGVKYYNADGTSAHTWDRSGNVTLWAKWEQIPPVKVTFGKNGGTGGDNYVTATYGKAMPTPRTAPKLSGWTFGGYWDTLACDEKGNPKGKQYYNAKMESVRAWDKTAATTLWAKWTVKVTLGKNGGTGGDSYVTVIKGQPFPKRTMPTKSGYTFGGYFVSASSKTGRCYNPDGTGTASMKWTTGGTPTVWALWTKTASCVELPPAVARRAATVAPTAAPALVPAGLYSGVLADGTGAFWLVLDAAEEGCTAFIYVASEDGSLTAECTAEEVDGILLLTTENGEVFAFDPAAGTLGGI